MFRNFWVNAELNCFWVALALRLLPYSDMVIRNLASTRRLLLTARIGRSNSVWNVVMWPNNWPSEIKLINAHNSCTNLLLCARKIAEQYYLRSNCSWWEWQSTRFCALLWLATWSDRSCWCASWSRVLRRARSNPTWFDWLDPHSLEPYLIARVNNVYLGI